MEDGGFRCWCVGTTRDDVLRAWRSGARSVEEVISRTGACSRCGTCRPELEALLAELRTSADAAQQP